MYNTFAKARFIILPNYTFKQFEFSHAKQMKANESGTFLEHFTLLIGKKYIYVCVC